MNFLLKILEKKGESIKKGPFAALYPAHEALESFLFAGGQNTKGKVHVRDAVDLKRVMIIVVVALIPSILMAMYNTGYQANTAMAMGAQGPEGFRAWIIEFLGLGYSPSSIVTNFMHGALYYVPILIVTFAAGGICELVFAVIRKHEVNEGFLVTGMLFPLILPATIPLWQVAIGMSFGVIIAKEVFGGTGYNVFNPALVGRAFLFFGYPAQISGDKVWIAADGLSGATLLAQAQEGTAITQSTQWLDAFLGFIPGSMGETSTLAILIGAFILLVTGVGSWRIMLSISVGTALMATILNLAGSESNSMFAIPFYWHMVIGGLAFAAVFMATDPVTAPRSKNGQLIYGLLIGALIIIVRVLNPAYPEGTLVVILLMNVFSPLIDHYAMRAHIKKRRNRYAQ